MADMDPQVLNLLNQFDSLQTVGARRAAYRGLLDRLSPHEWRDVQKRVNTATFQKDILGSVPTEIAVQIAKYLDLSDLHVLQRVSTKWKSILTSSMVRSILLQQYTGQSNSFQTVESQADFVRFAKHRLRLERGQPCSELERPGLPVPGTDNLSSLDYAHGIYAWLDNESVNVHSLKSNRTRSFRTVNREPFVDLRLSESLIAALTYRGHCHAWSLNTDHAASIRLPSRYWRIYIARGDYVVLIQTGTSDTDPASDLCMVWNVASRACRTIQIAPNLVLMDLNPATDTLVTTHLERNDEHYPPAQLRITRHALNGVSSLSAPTSTTSSILLDILPPSQPTIPSPNTTYTIEQDKSTQSRHNYRLGVLSIRQQSPPQPPTTTNNNTETTTTSSTRTVIIITYHPPTDNLTLHTLQASHTPFIPLSLAPTAPSLLYYIKNDHGKPTIWISNPSATVPHRPAQSMDSQLPREATRRVYSYASDLYLLGDERAVLLVSESGIRAWCFSDDECGDGDGDSDGPFGAGGGG